MATTYETATDFVLIEPEQIQIAEPPDPTADNYDPTVYHFHNPRGHSKGGGFDKEPMKELETSIINNGLQLPLLLRIYEGQPQLIAGQRRLQTILNIKQKKQNGQSILVYNIHTKKMEPADQVYSKIFVRIIEDCDDETALTLAVDENEQSQPLTVCDQVRLVEGLIASGMTPNEICKRLTKNAAWVNHTQHFRDSLPKGCFEALMVGDINRHVATELLKYPEEDREEIWDEAIAALTGKREKKRKELEDKVEVAAGEVEVADATVALADELDLDKEEAQSHQNNATESLEGAMEDLEEFESKPESMTGGDITESAQTKKKKPKTPQAFNKKKIEKHYIEPLRAAMGIEAPGGEPDSTVKHKCTVTGKIFPQQLLQCGLEIAEGIVNQDADVFEVLREYLFDTGKWDRPENEEDSDEYEEEEDSDEYEEDASAEYEEDEYDGEEDEYEEDEYEDGEFEEEI